MSTLWEQWGVSGELVSTVVLGHWCHMILLHVLAVSPHPQGSLPLSATHTAFLSSPWPLCTRSVAPGSSSSVCWPWSQGQSSWGYWRLQWG